MSSEEDLSQELAEKIEELQQKVERQEEKMEQQQQKIEELKQKDEEISSTLPENVDRRSFMKMLGLGAGGLAFTSMASADFFKLGGGGGGGSTQTLSDVLSEGNDIDGQDIVDAGTTVWDTSAGHVPASQIQTTGLDADTVDGNEASDLGGITYVQSSKPSSPSAGETWFDTDTAVLKVYSDLGNGKEWRPVPPISTTREITNFNSPTEASVSQLSNVSTYSSYMQLDNENSLGSTSLNLPDTGSDTYGEYGTVFTVQDTSGWDRIELVVDPDNGDDVEIYVENLTTGEQLVYEDYTSGFVNTLYVNIYPSDVSAGDEIVAYVAGSGTSWTWAGNTSPSFNYSGSVGKLDATNGWQGGSQTSGAYYNVSSWEVFEDVQQGEAVVTFSEALSGIKSWNLATFQRTLNGGALTVDIEDSSDTVVKSDIDTVTDISNLDTGKDLQFRFKFDRSGSDGTTGRPKVTYAAQRFVK